MDEAILWLGMGGYQEVAGNGEQKRAKSDLNWCIISVSYV